MPRYAETRTVDTAGVALTTIINKRPAHVGWIAISVEAQAGQGVLEIYDGLDREGDLKFKLEPGYAHSFAFVPPFLCQQGITIYNDANIAGYTIGFEVVRRAPFMSSVDAGGATP